jgi:polyhydroxybutyrate depolymerase
MRRFCIAVVLIGILACNLAGSQALDISQQAPASPIIATPTANLIEPTEVAAMNTMTASALPTRLTIPSTETPRIATPASLEPIQTPTRDPARGAILATVLAGTIEGEIDSGGVKRHYQLHIPPTYLPGKPAPLVINMHGLGSNSGEQEILSDMSRKADHEGFLVVYPDGLDGKWSLGPGASGEADQQFIRDLIQYLQGQYTIDPRRIYATGMSNGGGMANRLGCDLSEVIAAIAPVSGAYFFWQDCQSQRPVPVLAFHGTDDKVVPYEGAGQNKALPSLKAWAEDWASRNGCHNTSSIFYQAGSVTGEAWEACQEDASVVLYTIAGYGHSWPGSPLLAAIATDEINATDVMWEFFQAHPLE